MVRVVAIIPLFSLASVSQGFAGVIFAAPPASERDAAAVQTCTVPQQVPICKQLGEAGGNDWSVGDRTSNAMPGIAVVGSCRNGELIEAIPSGHVALYRDSLVPGPKLDGLIRPPQSDRMA